VDSKNVLKTVILSVQVGFRGDFIPDCLYKLCLKSIFGSSNFDTAFLPDCIKFCSVFSGCQIGNLMRISKMCLKQYFFYFKRVT